MSPSEAGVISNPACNGEKDTKSCVLEVETEPSNNIAKLDKGFGAVALQSTTFSRKSKSLLDRSPLVDIFELFSWGSMCKLPSLETPAGYRASVAATFQQINSSKDVERHAGGVERALLELDTSRQRQQGKRNERETHRLCLTAHQLEVHWKTHIK